MRHMVPASANVVIAGTEPSRSLPERESVSQCCISQSSAPLITAQPPTYTSVCQRRNIRPSITAGKPRR